MNLTPRRRRGEPSPVHAGLVFLRYKRSKEIWVTPDQLKKVTAQSRVVNARQRKKDGRREKASEYALRYGRTPKRKAKQAEYYSSPEVRERLRLKRLYDPVLIAKREKRALEKDAREEFKLTPEFAAKKLAKSRRDYAMGRERIIAGAVQRRRSNPAIRIKQNISRGIRKAMGRTTSRKDARTHELLGCTIPGFMGFLERQFLPGMTWKNYGEWHIDHIIPVARFDLTEPVSVRHAFNYRNTRPEWRIPNISKSDKLDMALVAKHELWEWMPYVTEPLSSAA